MKFKLIKDGVEINRIEATIEFTEQYCKKTGCTFEEIAESSPTLITDQDRLEAQTIYTAMMTDTLIGG